MPVTEAPDPNAFRDFEHAGWQINVSEYEDTFVRLTSQAIGPLLDAVGLRRGARLLDVATGPGYVAAAALRQGHGERVTCSEVFANARQPQSRVQVRRSRIS